MNLIFAVETEDLGPYSHGYFVHKLFFSAKAAYNYTVNVNQEGFDDDWGQMRITLWEVEE